LRREKIFLQKIYKNEKLFFCKFKIKKIKKLKKMSEKKISEKICKIIFTKKCEKFLRRKLILKKWRKKFFKFENYFCGKLKFKNIAKILRGKLFLFRANPRKFF